MSKKRLILFIIATLVVILLVLIFNTVIKPIAPAPIFTVLSMDDGVSIDGLVFESASQNNAILQADYDESNTIKADSHEVQNPLIVKMEDPDTINYTIYRLDGTIYDNGNHPIHSSISTRIQRTEMGLAIYLPSEPGEYIYKVVLSWRDVSAIYGIKAIIS